MFTQEVVVLLQGAGWVTTMQQPEHFRTYVRQALRHAGFAEKGGKWVR
jgi:hypothetical protein